MFILLVEDHDDTRRAMVALLKLGGHRVIAVATAQEAIAAASDGVVLDCAIIDLGLPDTPGTELMRQLKLRGLTRGIALTGSTLPADIARCREAGFAAYLPKPVGIEEVEAAIRRISSD
jgi:CheY-like chemotaxis protein